MAGDAQMKTFCRSASATAIAGGYVEGFGRDSKTGQLVATTRGAQQAITRMTAGQKRSILKNINSGMKRRYK